MMICALLWSSSFATEVSGSIWRSYKSDATIIEGLMWEDQSSNEHSVRINKAKSHCENLKLRYYGMEVDGWRLPSVGELKRLHLHRKKLSHTAPVASWSSKKSKRGKPIMVTMANGRDSVAFHPAMTATARCVKSHVKGYPSENMSLSGIIKSLSKATIKNEATQKRVLKPKVPALVPAMPLDKDEFETSAMFAKRVAEEKERVARINSQQKKAYEKALVQYHTALKESKKSPQTQQSKSYLGKAMYIKYGKPFIGAVTYNADEEIFDIQVISQRSKYDKDALHKNLLSKEVTFKDRYFTYTITRIEHVSKKASEVSITFLSTRPFEFWFGSHMGAKVWSKRDKAWYDLRDDELDCSVSRGDRLKFKVPKIKSTYYAFKKHKIVLAHYSPAFEANYKLSVPFKFAKAFKQRLLEHAFNVGVNVSKMNGKIDVVGLEGISSDSVRWLAEYDFEEAYDSIERLKKFVQKYAGKPYVQKAKERIAQLEAIKAAEAKEDEKRAALRAQKEAKERKAYNATKHIGDKVCMEGKMLLFMTVRVSGYVESVNDNKIQLRIADTEGQSPNYHGVTLRQNSVIWDDYNRWKSCD